MLIPMCLLLACSAFAQEPEKELSVYYVTEDWVKPSMIVEYEAALKDYVRFMAEGEFPYAISILRTEDFHYYIISPIKGTYTECDSIDAAASRIARNNQEGYRAMFSKFNDTYFSSKSYVNYLARNISYFPAEPRIKGDEERFCQIWFVKVKLGQQAKFIELMKEYNALGESKNNPNPYTLYRGALGMEQNMFILLIPAKDPADLWNSSLNEQELLGEEGRKINMALMKLIDQATVQYGWWMTSMTYIPGK